MKILYVSTISNTINSFLVPHIQFLAKQGHQVDVACRVVQDMDVRLAELGCRIYDIPFDRVPWKLQNLTAYRKMKEIVDREQYHIVHTHTPVASVCARLACRKSKATVVYTAHGFHFYKGAPAINWLVYYPLELWLSGYTDVLITINREDYEISRKRFRCRRVEYVPGVGIDISKFRDAVVDRPAKRRELGIPENAFVVLSIGELNANKNHETVIKAIARLRDPKVYYVICGTGPLESRLKQMAADLGIPDQVRLPGYRTDIPELCKTADLFVFPSFREGLPVSLMEAMASGLPVVCSDIRGNRDLVGGDGTGSLIKPYDVDRFCQEIKDYIHRDVASDIQRRDMHRYSTENVIRLMKEIYSSLNVS